MLISKIGMSLTSFLNIREVRKMFRDVFPVERVRLEGDLKAPPITKNRSIVGSAFDYLFRFRLEREFPNCITREGWVAESGATILKVATTMENNQHFIDGAYQWVASDTMLSPEEMALSFHAAQLRGTPNLAEASKDADRFLAEAKHFHQEYLKTGEMSDDLIKSSILLAQLDVIRRIDRVPDNFGQVDRGDIEDLENLMALLNPVTFADTIEFTDNNACYLNPTFGDGSVLVGGADADLILGDMLIDIKTVKDLKFGQEMYNQLIGYYILSKLGQVGGKSNFPISRLGIYFSRYGILHTISVQRIEDHLMFPEFVRNFEKMAKVAFSKKK